MSSSKRRRLAETAGTKFISDAALASLLQKLKPSDVEDGASKSRRAISRAVECDAAVTKI